jgi:hypothetical protein
MADETPDAPEPTPKKKGRDKAALPFSEDAETLDGRAWNRKPLVVAAVVIVAVVVIALVVLAGNDLASEGDDGGGDGTVPPPPTTTTTIAPTTTSTTTTSTTAPPPTTGPVGPQPGDACAPNGDIPDCVDPDGDGNYQIVTGGDECLRTADDPLECNDNDGDGDAGPAVIPT